MDVSRIEAISPRQIDWRRLTAKEIIKYEQQGIDVPMQYLQWAQEFVNSVYSDDKTTYQMASTTVTKDNPNNAAQVNSEEASGEEIEATDESAEEEPKTEAQTQREALQDNGVSLRKQARIFTGDSKAAKKEVIKSVFEISSAEKSSEKEIEMLELYMHILLSKAESAQEEFKSEVEKINNGTSNKITFAKMNILQKQLEKYGNQGQSKISSTEADLTGYEAIMNAQTPAIAKANDFGSETIIVGNELIDTAKSHGIFGIIDRIIGKTAVKSGTGAVDWSERTGNIQTEALSANKSHQASATAYKSEVEAKTGVAGNPSPKAENEDDKNKQADSNSKIETKIDNEKANKTAQNDGTDTADKVSTNIDEILKRKIRKGENVDAPTV